MGTVAPPVTEALRQMLACPCAREENVLSFDGRRQSYYATSAWPVDHIARHSWDGGFGFCTGVFYISRREKVP